MHRRLRARHEGRLFVLLAALVMDNAANLTLQDFSEGLGCLIINSQAGAVSVEEQIVGMESAMDALRAYFPERTN
jgi:hypothetical protein